MKAVLQYYDTTLGIYRDVGLVRTAAGKVVAATPISQEDRLGDTIPTAYRVSIEATALELHGNFLDAATQQFRIHYPDDLKQTALGTRAYSVDFDGQPARNEIVTHTVKISFISESYDTYSAIIDSPMNQPEGDLTAWIDINGGLAGSASGTDSRGFTWYNCVDGSGGAAQYETYVFAAADFPENIERHYSFTIKESLTLNHAMAFCLSQVSGAEFDFACLVTLKNPALYFKDTYNWRTYSEITSTGIAGGEVLIRFGLKYGAEAGTNLTGAVFSAYSGNNPIVVDNEGIGVQGNTTMTALAISD